MPLKFGKIKINTFNKNLMNLGKLKCLEKQNK